MPGNPDHYSQIVEQYHRYRPRYPSALIGWLRATCGLTPAHQVADIGAGTGQLSALLLEHGHRVIAAEPNAAMREMAARHLGSYAGFAAVDGTAEATTLPDQPPFWRPAPPEAIGTPLLWVAAGADAAFPERVARRSADYYGADYMCVEGAGHDLMLERSSAATARSIHTWLAERVT